nr:MAG TPA: hypothetical protein [Caudoviricetes sp.]
MSGRSPRLISVTRSKLPQGYTELSYIESNGGEYIDTGVSVDATNYNKLKFVVDCEILGGNGSSGTDWFLNGSNTNGAYFYMGQHAGTYYYGCGGSADQNTGISVVSGRHTFTLDAANKKFTVSGVLDITATVANVTATARLILFGFDFTPIRTFRQKLYSAQIYQGKTLMCDFVPCMNMSNQQAGLFDLVSQRFFGNDGTGEFIAGPAA